MGYILLQIYSLDEIEYFDDVIYENEEQAKQNFKHYINNYEWLEIICVNDVYDSTKIYKDLWDGTDEQLIDNKWGGVIDIKKIQYYSYVKKYINLYCIQKIEYDTNLGDKTKSAKK